MATSEITHWAHQLEKHTRLANEAKERLTRALAAFGLALPTAVVPAVKERPQRLHGGAYAGSPRQEQVLAALKNSGRPMGLPEIVQAMGLPDQGSQAGPIRWVGDAVGRLVRDRKVARVRRGRYALAGSGDAKAAPKGRHAQILAVLKRHRILTVSIVAKELELSHSVANNLLWQMTKPTPGRPAVLVRVGEGQYAAASGPAALMAGLKEAVRPAGGAKRGRPAKKRPAEKPDAPENSAPPTPGP